MMAGLPRRCSSWNCSARRKWFTSILGIRAYSPSQGLETINGDLLCFAAISARKESASQETSYKTGSFGRAFELRKCATLVAFTLEFGDRGRFHEWQLQSLPNINHAFHEVHDMGIVCAVRRSFRSPIMEKCARTTYIR
jgi:hypothetical protein